MLYAAEPATFKTLNLTTWRENTAFWLQGQMRHIPDLTPHTEALLTLEMKRLRGKAGCLVDVGCGEAWILRLLRRLTPEWQYLGMDFNPDMIAALKRRYAVDKRAAFAVQDIEDKPLPDLIAIADVVVCSFSLFEVPQLGVALNHLAALLKPTGRLIVFGIEPLAQLIAISHDWNELQQHMRQYETLGSHAAYDKDIDAGESPSGRIYRGILYSTVDYMSAALDNGLRVLAVARIVRTANRIPQVYESLVCGKVVAPLP